MTPEQFAELIQRLDRIITLLEALQPKSHFDDTTHFRIAVTPPVNADAVTREAEDARRRISERGMPTHHKLP